MTLTILRRSEAYRFHSRWRAWRFARGFSSGSYLAVRRGRLVWIVVGLTRKGRRFEVVD